GSVRDRPGCRRRALAAGWQHRPQPVRILARRARCRSAGCAVAANPGRTRERGPRPGREPATARTAWAAADFGVAGRSRAGHAGQRMADATLEPAHGRPHRSDLGHAAGRPAGDGGGMGRIAAVRSRGHRTRSPGPGLDPRRSRSAFPRAGGPMTRFAKLKATIDQQLAAAPWLRWASLAIIVLLALFLLR